MEILIITPMKKEFHCAREVFGASEAPFEGNFRFAVKHIRNSQLNILQCGFKPAESMQIYHDIYGTPDIMIDSGSCGGLKSSFLPGKIYTISTVKKDGLKSLCYDSPDSSYKLPKAALVEVSGAIDDENTRSELAENADICSMESYEICLAAEQWACRHYSFRVVTDLADSAMQGDFKRNFRESCQKLYGFLNTFLNDLSH